MLDAVVEVNFEDHGVFHQISSEFSRMAMTAHAASDLHLKGSADLHQMEDSFSAV